MTVIFYMHFSFTMGRGTGQYFTSEGNPTNCFTIFKNVYAEYANPFYGIGNPRVRRAPSLNAPYSCPFYLASAPDVFRGTSAIYMLQLACTSLPLFLDSYKLRKMQQLAALRCRWRRAKARQGRRGDSACRERGVVVRRSFAGGEQVQLHGRKIILKKYSLYMLNNNTYKQKDTETQA